MDKKQEHVAYKFGLIGKNIEYSFSRNYFNEKFKNENLPHSYENFDFQSISEFTKLIANTKNLKGLNVTIPYKIAIIPFLDKLDKTASIIGAVNTIKISDNGQLIGYNTDYYGFIKSIKPHLKPYHTRALILGTGGASKAIAYGLRELKINFDYVSRKKTEDIKFTYDILNKNIITDYKIIINCTPLGTYPDTNRFPDIPYDAINNLHLLYDLIYNPQETKFLSKGASYKADTCNGEKMLTFQADKAWQIWK